MATLCFTGHRPNKLYGYDLTDDKYKKLYFKIQDICIQLIEKYSVKQFISGGALGLDTISFVCIHKQKKLYPNIKNILAIPFENQPSLWKENDIIRYKKMLKVADDIIIVDKLKKYQIKNSKINEYNPLKMTKRNEYMVNNSDFVLGVWNGLKKGGTYNCLKYAKQKNKNIILLNPIDLSIRYIKEK